LVLLKSWAVQVPKRREKNSGSKKKVKTPDQKHLELGGQRRLIFGSELEKGYYPTRSLQLREKSDSRPTIVQKEKLKFMICCCLKKGRQLRSFRKRGFESARGKPKGNKVVSIKNLIIPGGVIL